MTADLCSMAPNESSSAVADRHSWLHRFAWFTTIATLFLICSGGMVTSKGVGLAVPDWPTTFGYNMFLFPVSKWVGGIFFEHTHRLIASTVGFLTIILAVWIWRVDQRRWLRHLGFAALGAVILQGVLGGLRVTLLKDEIGVFHALLAQAFFGILIVITLATSRLWQRLRKPQPGLGPRTLARAVIATTLLIYLQLGLGATMRHQHRDLSILDFPLAYGAIIPDTSPTVLAKVNEWREARALSDVAPSHIWLQMAHRFVALLIGLGVCVCLVLARKTEYAGLLSRFTDAWFLLLSGQLTLGAWVIWSNKAADIATAHVALGAMMFGFGIALSAIALRLASNNENATAPRSAAISEQIPVT
jgi:cytochrome c oxidase assembly protein subunit 15